MPFSLYKQAFFLSFLYFVQNSKIRAHLSPLPDDHTIQILHPSSSYPSYVHDGAGYDEMYPSGHKDPNVSNEERSPSTSSSSDEDLEMEKPEGDSSDDLIDADPPTQSVIGPDRFREFI